MCAINCERCGFDPASTRTRRLAKNNPASDTVPIPWARRPGPANTNNERNDMVKSRGNRNWRETGKE